MQVVSFILSASPLLSCWSRPFSWSSTLPLGKGVSTWLKKFAGAKQEEQVQEILKSQVILQKKKKGRGA